MSGCEELVGREGGLSRWNTDDVQGSEAILYDTLMVDTCCYTSVQTHRLYSTQREH